MSQYLLRKIPKPLWDEVKEYIQTFNDSYFSEINGLPKMSIKSFIFKAIREKLDGDNEGVKIRRHV